MTTRPPRQLFVRSRPGARTHGLLVLAGRTFRCALGRSGIRVLKREGDGATPAGPLEIESVFYRSDKVCRPRTLLPIRPITPRAGWCDAPTDRNYNRPVVHPYPASAEHLWRADDLYDLVVVLSHNRRPRRRGCGSAVFLHIARPGFAHTEGCVAMRHDDLMRLLGRLRPGDRLCILP